MHVTLGTLSCQFMPWRPPDGRIFDYFAYDTETTPIDDERPYLTPSYVLGAACDGQRGVFIARNQVAAFFQAHRDVPFVMHHAAFDLRVTDALLQPDQDLYQAVDARQVWDTEILQRLFMLATEGHTARGQASLAHCVESHLGIHLDKEQTDEHGKVVRTGFGDFLGRPPATIPREYLGYLGQDALATWHLFLELKRRIKQVLGQAAEVYGYVGHAWLQDVTQRFGPLTHHVQLRASIIADVLRNNGLTVDASRRQEKAHQLERLLNECKGHLRQRGYLPGETGSDKALQSILAEFQRDHPDLDLKKTASGKWSATREDLVELMTHDSFFADLITYRTADKLLTTYLRKLGVKHAYPRFGYLLQTGRTYCGGGLNLQNLPKEKDAASPAATIRGCFVPGDGQVFVDADYGQIELVVLAYVLEHQLGLPSQLAKLINSGLDVHRLIAAQVLDKEPAAITSAERNAVKAISFGRPGGMGVECLRRVAKNNYGFDLTTAQVQERIDAYHRLCPELTPFLEDEVDSGQVIARTLGLSQAAYQRARGWSDYSGAAAGGEQTPGWLGGMLLKTLREATPVTQQGCGRPYTAEEVDYFWTKAQGLSLSLPPAQQASLRNRQADPSLWESVRNWAGRRAVFTLTGRLRARTTFCAARNTLFQGPAADGALLGLWRVWRAGYRLVDFIHDQLVVEVPADEQVPQHVAAIEQHLKDGMAEVIPGMVVKVESVVTCSLNKHDLHPSYPLAAHAGPVMAVVPVTAPERNTDVVAHPAV
ncbi:MAG: hypothetical protein JNM56_33790 [Planctomycetia bacterium]|nr:hypothetical protein [Planctomycetia bacterium]